MEEADDAENILGEEVGGQGFGDLREDGFEALDAKVDPIVRFPELRTES